MYFTVTGISFAPCLLYAIRYPVILINNKTPNSTDKIRRPGIKAFLCKPGETLFISHNRILKC